MTRKNTMEEHHYPIIVEGDWGPAKNTKNKLQIHFQSKKKSQGGDCMVRYNDGSNFATILFKSSHIRDEVLSKAEHIINIDNQQIKLKVYKPSDPEEQADSTGTKMEQAYGYQEPNRSVSSAVVLENLPDDVKQYVLTLLVAGMTHEITGLKPIIEKFLERGTNQLEREKNSVTEYLEISPAMYSLLEQDSLKTVCPHLQIDYNKKINRLYLSGLHTEILIFKNWVLEKKINMKQKSLQINSSILEFLKSVDCDEMSRDLFISHGITAVYTIANEDVVVIGSTERALKEAEKRINTVLITKDLTVEDQGVLQMPEWLNLKKQLENMFSTHKKISVLINLSRKRDKVLVSGFRKPVMEVSENLGRFIEEHTKIVEKVHVQSHAVVDFIKDRKSQDWQHFIKSNEVKVSFDPKKPLIKLSGERAFVQPARIFFERLAGGLYTDTLIIKKAGAKKYFKDQGKIMLSILLKEIRFVVVLQEDDMREEEGDLFQDEIEPAIFQLCGETPKDLSEARDMIKSMILREHVTIPIRDPAIAHFTKEDGETLNAMQRELTVSVRLEKKGQDSVITLEGLTRDVHTADSRIRNMIRKVERKESRATIQRNKVDMKAGAQSPLPSHWKDMTGQPVILVNLTAGSKEYADVEKEFRRTNLTFNIIKIERVQNGTLWKSYMIKKEELEVKNKHKNNEKLLFHGTDADKTDQINHHGFNRSFAGMHGAVYGNGTYFAVDPSYSARGYSKPDVNGHKRMYLARVLVGDFTQGKPGLPVPPAKSSSSVDLYNSVTDNMTNPSMFVIFNDVQAYPEYLITFQQGRAGAYIDHRKFLSHSAHNFIW